MYPRVGAPLLPDVLIPMLVGEPLSTSAVGLSSGVCLGQLDERVWVEHERNVVLILARDVVGCVTRRWREIAWLQTRVSFGGASIEQLDVSVRARNGLLRNDWARHHTLPGMPLRDVSVCELALIPGFGAQSLLDVLTVSSEASPAPVPTRSREVMLAARGLARAPWSGLVSREDPRLGGMVRALDEDAASAREAAQRAAERTCGPVAQALLVPQLNALAAEGTRLRRLRLDEELQGIVGAVLEPDSSRDAVIARLGLGGAPPATRDRAGRAADVTPERVRQIEKSFRDAIAPALKAGGVWTPAVDRALQIIRHTKLATSQELHTDLASRGLIPDGFSTSSILAAARVFGKPLEVYAEHGLIFTRPLPATAGQIAKPARWLVTHWGATTIDAVRARLRAETGLEVPAQVARLLLETQQGFCWLDERRGWFWIRTTALNRVLNQVEKILSVSPSVTTRELRAGVGRHHRMKGLRLPRHVLAALCAGSGRYELRGNRVLAKRGHPCWQERLGEAEATLVAVLLEHGPVVRHAALEQIAVHQHGMNPHSFTLHLASSPVLTRYARGVYGLRGTQATRTGAPQG